jgi:hypothetical protein
VNVSVGCATLLVGDGSRSVDFEVPVDSDDVRSIGGVAVGTAPHPTSAAVLISAQVANHAR